MRNKINILVIVIVFIWFQNLSKLYSSELIFDGHIKYELLNRKILSNELRLIISANKITNYILDKL